MTVETAAPVTAAVPTPHPPRTPSVRDYVMCPPEHFAVDYAINPWMDPSRPVNRSRALHRWESLRAVYERLGHRVRIIDPLPGMPDMVFAANGAFVVDGRALGARFRDPVRAAEAPAHRAWLERAGVTVHAPEAVNEGEGDFAWTGTRILAGSGFRSDPASHAELAAVFDVPVVSLRLVDERFYHLDTALAVLDSDTIVYYPPAFSSRSRRLLAELYPDAIIASEHDAALLGLNAVSDGRHVVMAEQAERLAADVEAAGFDVIPVDVSELLKAGGGVKCATLELHRRRLSARPARTHQEQQ